MTSTADRLARAGHRILALAAALLAPVAAPVLAQQLDDPIPQTIPRGLSVEIGPYLQMPPDESGDPFAPLQFLYRADDGSGRLFVADLRGQVWLIDGGQLAPEPFLDAAAVLGDDLRSGCNSCGVRAFAFHPEFAVPGSRGFGKFYTLTIQTPDSTAKHPATPRFAWTASPITAVDVVSEWQVDPLDANRIDPASEREVLRIEQRQIGHSTEHLGFRPGLAPDDPDFGMLYVSIGDGGFDRDDPDPFRAAQDRTNLMGTIIRIDPLGEDSPGYSLPGDNPFLGDPGALDEIWAYGLRNPQRFSWDGAGRLLIADIGQSNIEEINLGSAGANYGWSEREGTFVLDRDDPSAVRPRPMDDARFGFTYPVLQYDHDVALVASGLVAITGGFVYRGSRLPELVGHYLFGDLVSGRIFYAAAANLVAGRQAAFQELILTQAGVEVRLLDLIGEERVDLRFGEGEDGEIYLLTKQDGAIRTLGVPVSP